MEEFLDEYEDVELPLKKKESSFREVINKKKLESYELDEVMA